VNGAERFHLPRFTFLRIAREIEGEFGVVENPSLTRHITAVALRIATVSARAGLPWTFKILNTNEVNAVSLPGGFIYVTKGMLGFLRSTDELAFVLGHEIGHVVGRHHVQLLERDFYFSIILSYLFGGNPDTARIANFARGLATRGFGREFEFEADRYGVIYSHKAGFNAVAALTFMERLRSAQSRDPSQFEVLFRTHPALGDRIVRVRTELRVLGYRLSALHPAAKIAMAGPQGLDFQLVRL